MQNTIKINNKDHLSMDITDTINRTLTGFLQEGVFKIFNAVKKLKNMNVMEKTTILQLYKAEITCTFYTGDKKPAHSFVARAFLTIEKNNKNSFNKEMEKVYLNLIGRIQKEASYNIFIEDVTMHVELTKM